MYLDEGGFGPLEAEAGPDLPDRDHGGVPLGLAQVNPQSNLRHCWSNHKKWDMDFYSVGDAYLILSRKRQNLTFNERRWEGGG